MEPKILLLLILIATTPVILLFVILGLSIKIKQLNNVISELKSDIGTYRKKNKSFLKFYVGSKALLNNYQLAHTPSSGNKVEFSVDFEVEVVDVSETEIKVKAIDFVGNDKFSRDPQNRSGIISFLQNKWIPKNDAELIMSESHSRQVKLEELGI